jgi:hypothetical protein
MARRLEPTNNHRSNTVRSNDGLRFLVSSRRVESTRQRAVPSWALGVLFMLGSTHAGREVVLVRFTTTRNTKIPKEADWKIVFMPRK